MKRRRFLQGLGGITVGLPALQALAPRVALAGPQDPVRRVIVMAYPMGTHVPAWSPSATGTTFELGSISAPMEPFKDRTLFVSNTPNAILELGGNAHIYGHPCKKESVFTGTLMQHAFLNDGSNRVENIDPNADPGSHSRTANGPSVETFIGEALRQPSHRRASVDLGIWGGGGVRDPQSSDFFYESAANPVTMMANPATAFASLFDVVNPDGEVDEQFVALQRRKASVLDAVRENFVDLRQGLDADDRRILDDHADKIRQIELDMQPLAACSLPQDIPEAVAAYTEYTMMELGELQNRILAHAMGCDLAPVGRIEYLDQQNPRFGIPFIDDAVATVQDWHHPIVHADDGWTKDDPVRVQGFTFFVQKFADLCSYLDGIVEGPDGRTALDNSLIVLGSDLAEGDGHSAFDLCFMVVGDAGPGRRGLHVDGSSSNVNEFLTALVNMAGVTHGDGSPVREFGVSGFVDGPMSGVLV